MLVAVGIFLAVAVGAALQRISGMGLGLLAAPALSLLVGPVTGVLLINVLATINAASNTIAQRADVDWRKFTPIALALAFGAVPGAFVIRAVSPDALMLIVGVVLIVALSVVTLGKRHVPHVEGVVPAAASGVAGGFMNTLAGVAGPAITVYAQAARWEHRTYAATLQPIFLVSGALSFLIKEVTGAADLSAVSPLMWGVSLVALVVGITAGTYFAPRVPSGPAHKIALGLAFFGGFVALVRGLVGLLGG